MTTTATGPGETICVGRNCAAIPGSAASTDMKPGLLCKRSTGTYGNGYDVTDAAYGDSNTGEGTVYQAEIRARHPKSTVVTPYDKSNAYAAGDAIIVYRHEQGKAYWLPASSITCSVDDKLICAADGLVEKQTAHTATPLPHHVWTCIKAATSKNWVLARYEGIQPMYTAA